MLKTLFKGRSIRTRALLVESLSFSPERLEEKMMELAHGVISRIQWDDEKIRTFKEVADAKRV